MHASAQMTKRLLQVVLGASWLVLVADSGRATPEPELLRILASRGGSVVDRTAAVVGLAVCGTAASVPVLYDMLRAEDLAHAALHALERIDTPEARNALREAVRTLDGPVQIGAIDAVGRRRDTEAVALLMPLLASGDTGVVSSAASSLGKIGGAAAMDALLQARVAATGERRSEFESVLLDAAEGFGAAGEGDAARRIFGDLLSGTSKMPIRIAAWLGVWRSAPTLRASMVLDALTGDDDAVRQAALSVIRHSSSLSEVNAYVARWLDLEPAVQAAVLEVHLGSGAAALPTLRLAASSPDAAVRAAAWRGYAQINDSSGLAEIIRAYISGDATEREAARDALARLHGPGVREALEKAVDRAGGEERIALLEVLGLRGERAGAPVLLRYAADDSAAVRKAALDGLRMLAAPASLDPLLELAARQESAADLRPILTTLAAVCRGHDDGDAASRRLAHSLSVMSQRVRVQAMPLLAMLGTDRAREAVLDLARDPDIETAAAALSTLAQWPDASPGDAVLRLLAAGVDPALRRSAFRTAMAVCGKETDPRRRLSLVSQAASLAGDPEERSQVLARSAGIPLPEALDLARGYLADPEVKAEAVSAILGIAERLASTDPRLAARTAKEALAQTSDPAAIRRAMALTPPPASRREKSVLPPRDSFERLRLSEDFHAEGAFFGDFNRDGFPDVVAGPFWYEGPEFKVRHEYRPAVVFNPLQYSDNFLTYTDDLDGDGWVDIIVIPLPGKECYWYRNPAGGTGMWERHLAYPFVGNESPLWVDVTGDGRRELLFCDDGFLGYATPDPVRPDLPWVFHAISGKDARFQRFTHGLGWGDINGDGRNDVIEAKGWWEQPKRASAGEPWVFHPFDFAHWAAQMHVYDVDGDGLNDVICAWHCHHYGLVWWRQRPGAGGAPEWERHVVFDPEPDVEKHEFRCSQMHAMDLADMNGDGQLDIVTGKRFWAHGPEGDKEPSAPAVVFWLELQRSEDGEVTFRPHLIDDDSGVGTQVVTADLNGDGRPDVIVANKKGVFVHLSRADR